MFAVNKKNAQTSGLFHAIRYPVEAKKNTTRALAIENQPQ